MHLRVLPDGPQGTLAKVAHNGGHEFVSSYGEAVEHPNALMEFADLEAAWRVVNGESGFEEAASVGDARFAGHVVLADHMNIFIRRLVSVMGL
jgi:hypothetical protein